MMPCKINIDASAFKEFINQIDVEKREAIIEKALKAEAELIKPVIEAQAPRSTRKKTGKWASRGHMADHIKISDVMVSRTGSYYIAIGPQLKPGSGYAYAPLVEYGTKHITANPFIDRAAEQAGDRAMEAAIEQLRKEMGLT